MDESESLGDAEMRFVTVNGQTVMLEGDLGNMCMTNELLNEMLLMGNAKEENNGDCGIELNGNACVNGLRGSEDPTKIELTIQGENNELQTIHIGMNEAKELGLYVYGIKDEGMEEWNQTCANNVSLESQEQVAVVSINNAKDGNMTGEGESVNKNKMESMPLLDVDSPDKDQNILLETPDLSKENIANGQLNGMNFDSCNGTNQKADVQEENSSDNFPAIGHLEGFQIPTADDGTLLPATVNAKMADGSYQMLTLIPQVGDGNVTYSVQFANLDGDDMDSKTFPASDSIGGGEDYNMTNICNSLDEKDVKKSKKTVVEEFLKSVQLKKNVKPKSTPTIDNSDQVTTPDNDKNPAPVNFVNLSMDQNILKLNSANSFTVPDNFNFNNLSVNYVPQTQMQTPIEAKIDNLISENENVIAKCKKVKYGKKVRQACTNDASDMLQNIDSVAKGSLVRGKKVKFKNRSNAKGLDEEVEEKKMKLSLLKPNNEQVQDKKESLQGGLDSDANNLTSASSNKNMISHVNLNCRLEYPNLKAIDDNASLPYLKMKSQNSPKQPYFNVLPYPKDKTVPAQRQYLPLSCDLQQAKNLISLQKFLETQKLQLRIQPISSSGSKMVNIRAKPTVNDQFKTLQDLGLAAPVLNGDGILTNNSTQFLQAGNQETKKTYSDAEDKVHPKNANDVMLSEGKINVLKFLNTNNYEQGKDVERESSADFDGKINGIFIKNNPEYFQKSKDGKAEEHPLGSSENPIQLVQTGHTFHSRQPLSETQLRQIASILQKQKFDSQNIKKNSIFDPKTNTRIVYRVVYPDDVELKRADEGLGDNSLKRKRGRNSRKPTIGEDDLQKPLGKGPRRPKKIGISLDEDIIEEEVDDSQLEQKKIPRTRSGRLSRPPRYMVKDYKRLNNTDVSDKNPNSNYESDEAYSDYIHEKEPPKERVNKIEELESNLLPGLRSPTRSKRNFKPEYRCPTCQKIYLGHSRMMWHLNKFPDHCNAEKYKEIYSRKPAETKARRAARRLNICDVSSNVKQILSSMSKEELMSLCGPLLSEALTTWDFLLLRVNLLKEDMKGEVDALLHELALLLEKLTKMAEDIFLPVFTKEGEKDVDCVEVLGNVHFKNMFLDLSDRIRNFSSQSLIRAVVDQLQILAIDLSYSAKYLTQIDKMEIAIALGLPTGFYKINNDNLSLLKLPLKGAFQERDEKESELKAIKGEGSSILNGPKQMEEKFKEKSFLEKSGKWEEVKDERKKIVEDFWMSDKLNEPNNWQRTGDSASIKALATKFEPNLSTKLLESSNDSIDDTKYEEPVQLIDLDSNSKDVEHSNSSENLDRSPDNNIKDHSENSESTDGKTLDKTSLWDAQGQVKDPDEIWNENSNITAAVEKSPAQLWSDKSNLGGLGEKRELWNENSNLNSSEKVDETNSEFLDSFLAVGNLGSESNAFLADSLMNDKSDKSEVDPGKGESKKGEWREERNENFIRIWDSDKNGEWSKEDADLLSGSIHERMPGLRTSNRLTSTPETNGNINFSIPNRRNSISDFTNINLEPSSLDIVLPPAKTLIKERTKSDSLDKMSRDSYPLKNNVFESSDNFKIKEWNDGGKNDFATSNVNSEDLMKIALESLTSHNDVINVPQTSFDSAMGILNPSQENGNLNLFTSSEADGLDFNLPLPDHLLRTNFTTSSTFQTTCPSNFSSAVSPTFLSTTNNLFGTTTSSSMDQFDANYQGKKTAEDDVIEFFDSKNSYTSYDTCMDGGGNVANFSFVSTSSHNDQYSVTQCLNDSIVSSFVPETIKKKEDSDAPVSKTRVKKKEKKSGRTSKAVKKLKPKRVIDYPKTNSIESIINEALFESCSTQCSSNSKSIQLENSSPNGSSAIPNGTDNYRLPIIPESLDEVGNLDFLNQD